MIGELDRVVLAVDLPEHGLVAGDMGTAVLVHEGGRAYEVEFVTLGGETAALLTLYAEQVRAGTAADLPHARKLVLAGD
jgi:hypothetical protein